MFFPRTVLRSSLSALMIGGIITGCTRSDVEPTTNVEAPPVITQVAQPSTRASDATSEVESTRLKMFVDDPRIENWPGVGNRQPGVLVSNGTNGYLMFGPRVAFQPGKYRVKIFGDALSIQNGNSIIFDATSDTGQQIHGDLTLDDKATFVQDQPLASFDFELPSAVQDLEIRVFVTSGSTIAIRSYEVEPVEPQG